MHLLIHLIWNCFYYILLLVFLCPLKQIHCLLLLLTYVLHFFKNCTSELGIIHDCCLDMELCIIKLVLEQRDILLNLLIRCGLDLKPDFIDLLLKWLGSGGNWGILLWLIVLLDELLEMGGGAKDWFDWIEDWLVLFNEFLKKSLLRILVI